MRKAKHRVFGDTVSFKRITRMGELLIWVKFESGETTDMTKKRFDELFEEV